MFMLAEGARRIDHALKIRHRAVGLPGLRACRAALLVQTKLLLTGRRFRVCLQQCHRAIEPLQRLAHREQLLRVLTCQPKIQKSLRPDVATLIVLREAGVAFVDPALRLQLQPFGHRPVQQHAPRRADIAVDDFTHLVVIEVVIAALLVLTQQSTLDQRFDGLQKALFRGPGECQQGFEVEAPAEHRGHLKQPPVFKRHPGQPHAHGIAQGARQRMAVRFTGVEIALTHRMHDRPEEERIAVGFVVQARREIRRTELRVVHPFQQRGGVGRG